MVRRVATRRMCMPLPYNVDFYVQRQLTSLSAFTASTTERYAPIQKSEPPTTARASEQLMGTAGHKSVLT